LESIGRVAFRFLVPSNVRPTLEVIMKEVRIGVIGCGGMARGGHMKVFPEVSRLKFTAAADLSQENLKATLDSHPNVKTFTNADELLDSGLVDAIFIGTPHYFHPQYALAAMKRGLHVMTEKPVAVTAKAAAEVNEVAKKHPKLKYGVMHQMRTVPKFRKAREIITSGQLGEIRRVQWTITTWFRSQAYYDSGSWRATWAGEGGGVLLNQCPHNLDLFQWMFGMPVSLSAKCAFGKCHDIEVEDDVTAVMEFKNGATGVFITSTGEAPGTNRLEITGERGKLVYEDDKITYTRNEIPMGEFSRTTTESFSRPATWDVSIPTAGHGGQHNEILQNFADAILDGAPPVVRR
jgi:predicted dehydrogenase